MHTGRGGFRFLCALCVFTLLFSAAAPTSKADEYPYTAYCTAALRIRKLPSTTADILEVMATGDAMTVIGESGAFLIIEYEGIQGFVQKDYVSRTRPEGLGVVLPVSEEAQRLYATLSEGSSGAAARALQQALRELGFYSSAIDGLYGQGTKRAVAAFQTANALLSDGVASPELQQFLYDSPVKNASGKTVTVLTLPPVAGRVMRTGNQGDAVAALQTRLAALGYFQGAASGVYDTATASAVRAFQQKCGLSADGVAGLDTQSWLYAENAPRSTDPRVTAPTPTIAPPATATPVPTQQALYPYDTHTIDSVNKRETPSVNGKYLGTLPAGTAITVLEDLKDFLRVSYMGETFYVASEYVDVPAAYQPTPTPQPAQGAYAPLSSGASGALVRALQEALKELGFYAITVDGEFGAGTEKAVKAFQEKNGLTKSGVATADMQKLLYEGMPKNSRGVKTDVKTLPPTGAVIMRLNDRGEAVSALQTRLLQMGYYTSAITGVYDAATQAAVRAFQKANGLTADGVAGARTQEMIASPHAVWLSPTPTPTPWLAPITPSPSPIPAPTQYVITPETVIVMQRGTRGLAVSYLQQRLTDLHYFTSKIDGVYDTAEINAVRAFQKKHGLLVDGIAGYETQSLLYSDAAMDALATPTPAPTPTPKITPPPVAESYKMGSTGEGVRGLQARLIELNYLSGAADGIYGAKTYAAVKAFQGRNSLSADGIAGQSTITRLYSANAVPARVTATPTPTPTPGSLSGESTTLDMGDTGEEVKRLQTRLIELRYLSAGAADGIFGAMTYIAVKNFQSRNGLTVDGRAGPSTQKKLYSTTAKDSGGVVTTPAPTPTPAFRAPDPASVRYTNWFTEIRSLARQAKYVVIYDFKTGRHWNIHMFSFGKHADSEPVTAEDTAIMNEVFGKTTWNPRAVWVCFPDGRVYMASMHNTPHLYGTIKENNFDGHLCIHFPRLMEEAKQTGPYAVSHQEEILAGWEITQAMIGR